MRTAKLAIFQIITHSILGFFKTESPSILRWSDQIYTLRFWGGITKSTHSKVGSRLQKNSFCENVPMSAPNDVVNTKTCLGYVIMRFCHFAKVSAPIQNIYGRTFSRFHPLSYPILGNDDHPQLHITNIVL